MYLPACRQNFLRSSSGTWSLQFTEDCQQICLAGYIHGHPDHADGSFIKTNKLEYIFQTEAGYFGVTEYDVYWLGTVDPGYI